MAFTRKQKKQLKKRKYYKKSRRYNKINKRRRKTKRRKRRRKKNTRKKRRRKKQRGGYSTYKCNSPTNMGEIYTGIKLNTNPFLPDPINSNTNIRGNQKGGHKESTGVSAPTSGMAGSFLSSIGLGDAVLNYYKGSNAIANQTIRYNGGKPLMKADPMHQPGLTTPASSATSANIPSFYNTASQTAAANTIS
tara:strand:+ start:63 stop:638 length:576 start_codon:yes stop_codon:yes gene_type:complete